MSIADRVALQQAREAAHMPTSRFAELDGLRGWAAMFVVWHHCMCAFAPSLVPDIGGTNRVIVDSPLGLFVNGPFWVYVFFVLSGFVLSASVDRRAPPLWLSVALRWPRLALPAAVSVVLSWLWLVTFGPPKLTPQAMLDVSPWLQYFHREAIPGAGAALRHGLFGVFVAHESLFNNVLWTMRVELVGSIAVFAFFALRRALGQSPALATVVPLLILAACLWAAFRLGVTPMPAFNCFAYGIAIYLTRQVAVPRWLISTALATGLAMACFAVDFSASNGLAWLRQSLRPESNISHSIGASLVVASLIRVRWRFLTHSVSAWLGVNSFALYLVHVPILYSIAIPAMLWLRKHGYGEMAPFGGAAIGLVMSLAVARLFTIHIDERVVDGLSWIKRRVWSSQGRHATAATPIGAGNSGAKSP